MAERRHVYLVHHLHTSKDLRRYSETAGDTLAKRDGWNVRDVRASGFRRGSVGPKIGTSLTRRGERHEFTVQAVAYFAAQTSEPATAAG